MYGLRIICTAYHGDAVLADLDIAQEYTTTASVSSQIYGLMHESYPIEIKA